MLAFSHSPHGVFGHDHSAVHDQPEVDRAETHQVAGDVEEAHEARGDQHRERDHRRGEQRAAPVAEQQDEDEDDDQRALDQVLGYGVDRAVDEFRPVIERDQFDPFRQRPPDLLDALLDARDDVSRVLADEHEGDAGDDLALALGNRRPMPDFSASHDLGHVAHIYGDAVFAGLNYDTGDILHRPDQPDAAQQVLLPG